MESRGRLPRIHACFNFCMFSWRRSSPARASAAEIRRGLGPEPDSIHIHQAQGLAAVNLLRDLREGLVTFDESGELVPGQAESWQVLDGGKRYRFTLRPDALWSNGDPVTAVDFVRAWQRAFTPDTAAATAGLLKDVVNAGESSQGRGRSWNRWESGPWRRTSWISS